jgi:crossover junction endodeoxyribonuclease RuvC
MIRILGIDPGLRHTGWGVIEAQGNAMRYLACGVIKTLSTDPLDKRLLSLSLGLQDVLEHYQPHEAAVEQTFVNRDAVATLKLGQARGIAILMPARFGIDVDEYAPNKVKKTIVGVGHADKRQVEAMVLMLLPKAKFSSSDAADALAIALCHAQYRGIKQHLKGQEEICGLSSKKVVGS